MSDIDKASQDMAEPREQEYDWEERNDEWEVFYDETLEVDVIRANVFDYIEGEEFREFMDLIIEGVEDTGCGWLVSDTRDMGPLAQEDQMWVLQDWAPRADAAGVDRISYAMPESVVAQLSVDNVLDMVDEDLGVDYENKIFDNLEDAEEWIVEKALDDRQMESEE